MANCDSKSILKDIKQAGNFSDADMKYVEENFGNIMETLIMRERSEDKVDAELEIAYMQVQYGSKANNKKMQWDKLQEFRKSVSRSPANMQKLLAELYELDGKKETDEHYQHLHDLIGMLDKNFFKEMETYVLDGVQETQGVVDGNKIGVFLSKQPKSATNEMGAAEVYTHELIHAIQAFAMKKEFTNKEVKKLMTEVRFLMKQVQEVLGDSYPNAPWKVLMPKDSINKEKEEQIAKEMYDYIFLSKNAEAEFLAHALTHPRMFEVLKTLKVQKDPKNNTIIEKLVHVWKTIVDVVLGNYDFKSTNKTAYEQAVHLSLALGQHNADSINGAEETLTVMERSAELLEEGNEAIQGVFDKVISRMTEDDQKVLEDFPREGSNVDKAVWYGKYFLKVMRNKTYKNYFGHLLSAYWVTPESPVRDWARAFMESSDMQKAVEWLGTTSDNIDRTRNNIAVETKNILLEKFNRKLTEDEEIMLQSILIETDMQSILDDYKQVHQIQKLLTDPAFLKQELNKAKKYLRTLNEDRDNWHVNQAHGLGMFLITGKGHKAQNLNAKAITRGYMSSNRKPQKNAEHIEAQVDKVATLTALLYSKKKHKLELAEMFKTEEKGIRGLLDSHKGLVQVSKDKVFTNGAETLMIKGHTKELFSDKVTMEVAPLSKRTEMEQRGFTFQEELQKDPNDKTEAMGLFTSESFMTNEWHSAGTRFTKFSVKGTSISQVHYIEGSKLSKEKIELAKIKMDKERFKLVEQLEKGEYEFDDKASNMLPILDQYGNVTDYRYIMPKTAKEKFLEQNRKVSDTISRSYSSVYDKEGSIEHNKKVLETILEYMKSDWVEGSTVGKDGMEFVLIGPNSTNADAKEIYKVLPPVFKEAIDKREDKTLAVPRELMHLYFGYRHISMADFPGLKHITPRQVRAWIRIAETMWIEAIKILKGNILMKMPFILVGNIVSNIAYAIMTGNINPVELTKDYITSFRDLRKFINNDREITRLEMQSRISGLSKKEQTKLKWLKREQEKNEDIKELVDLGMYQAVIEDTEMMELQETNKWKKAIDEKLKPVPALVKTPLQWLYLSSETTWYKVNQEVLQMSDLIARDVENKRRKKMELKVASGAKKAPNWWREKHGEYVQKHQREMFLKEAKEIRHYSLLETYVNYNKPASKLEEYLNRIGLIMFTKYTKNIQKIIAKSAYTHPINALVMLLGQEYLVDVETIQDQALLTRSWYNFGYGPGDVLPFHNPLEQFMEIMTPALVKPTTWDFVP